MSGLAGFFSTSAFAETTATVSVTVYYAPGNLFTGYYSTPSEVCSHNTYHAGVYDYYEPRSGACLIGDDNHGVHYYVSSKVQAGCPDSTWTLSGTTCTRVGASDAAAVCAAKKGQGLPSLPTLTGSSSAWSPTQRACQQTGSTSPYGCEIKANADYANGGSWAYSYTGSYCGGPPPATPAPKNTTDPAQLYDAGPAPNAVCPDGYTYGQVNNDYVCVKNAPTPGTKNPPITNDGKDLNGKCGAGEMTTYDGKCTKTNAPDSNGNCPSGQINIAGQCTLLPPWPYTPITQSGGGGSTTFNPTSNTNMGSGTASGTTGTASGTTGTASGTTGTGNGTDSGTCEYTGLLKFLCSDDSSPARPDTDTSNLADGVGGDLSSMLNTQDTFFGTYSCPPDITVPINLGVTSGSFPISFGPLCTFAQNLRWVLVAVSLVGASMIIFRRG
ncbi:virulence factor TspB C-terminal domain-related protein [Paludibacterium denitrificans]|uniref:Uncharacterized protein n=1 Tax=Paludibacterium denitrificans TaxID=2675226 RepID=A0A844GE38_9NEIS|nr:virulence factor TspB C-terminal domain-related protein [Paludibacterium denitrificans]MTD33909.1 hypothetical protein [Paludibacterium denitrificans]